MTPWSAPRAFENTLVKVNWSCEVSRQTIAEGDLPEAERGTVGDLAGVGVSRAQRRERGKEQLHVVDLQGIVLAVGDLALEGDARRAELGVPAEAVELDVLG